MDNTSKEITHLGERVGFAPTESDEKHIKSVGNDLGIGISEVLKRGLKLYYDMHTLGLVNDVRRMIDDRKTAEFEKLEAEIQKLREINARLERRAS